MYVYIESEPHLFTVGFYDSNDKWHPDSDHSNRENAVNRVAMLNGQSAVQAFLARNAEPVLYVHPMYLSQNTLAAECSHVRLGPSQVPLFLAPQPLPSATPVIAIVEESGDFTAQIRWTLNPLPLGSELHEGQQPLPSAEEIAKTIWRTNMKSEISWTKNEEILCVELANAVLALLKGAR